MSFFEDWLGCIEDNENDYDYIEAFLKKKSYSTRVFYHGNNVQISIACQVLLKYDLNKIVEIIDESFITPLDTAKVVQFSNFDNGTKTLVELLYRNQEGLSYPDIGRQLIGSEELNAATKYGENHSKLARDFNLVTISDSRPALVEITNFGKCFIFLEGYEQEKLLRILGFRDPLIINLIAKAKKGIVYYATECSCLSETTKIRRRSNVKKLFEYVLGNEFNTIKNNVIW